MWQKYFIYTIILHLSNSIKIKLKIYIEASRTFIRTVCLEKCQKFNKFVYFLLGCSPRTTMLFKEILRNVSDIVLMVASDLED